MRRCSSNGPSQTIWSYEIRVAPGKSSLVSVASTSRHRCYAFMYAEAHYSQILGDLSKFVRANSGVGRKTWRWSISRIIHKAGLE